MNWMKSQLQQFDGKTYESRMSFFRNRLMAAILCWDGRMREETILIAKTTTSSMESSRQQLNCDDDDDNTHTDPANSMRSIATGAV